MIRDRIVCEVNNNRIQRLQLQESKLTYERVKEVAQNVEAASKDVQKLQTPTATHHHNQFNMFISGIRQNLQCMPSLPRQQSQPSHQSSCHGCGGSHPRSAVNSRMLFVENVANEVILQESAERQLTHQNTPNTTFTTTDTALEEEIYSSPASVAKASPVSQEGTCTMFALWSKVQPIKVQVQLNSHEVTMVVDTGASLTVLNESIYSLIATNQELKPTATKLSTYTGQLLHVLGSFDQSSAAFILLG